VVVGKVEGVELAKARHMAAGMKKHAAGGVLGRT
jgi:hypothetical protein